MRKLDDADKYCIRFLSQLLGDDPYVSLVYHALGMMANAKGDYEKILLSLSIELYLQQ